MKRLEQRNKETVASFIRDFWNRKNTRAGEQLLAEDYADFTHKSKIGFMYFADGIFEAFPDGKHTIKECVADGDKVIVRIEFSGTNSGIFDGEDPTGKFARVTVFREFKIVEGKISSHRGLMDMMSLKTQIIA